MNGITGIRSCSAFRIENNRATYGTFSGAIIVERAILGPFSGAIRDCITILFRSSCLESHPPN